MSMTRHRDLFEYQPKMSKRAVLDDLRRMPYYKNYAAVSGAVHNISNHEDAVKDIFIKHGLVECPVDEKARITVKNGSGRETPHYTGAVPPCHFVSQPNGKNNSPDFMVRFGCETVYKFECKTTAKAATKPVYNSGGIKKDYIYVYSAAKHNKTTIYVGGDVCSMEQQRLIDELIQKQVELEIEYNKKLNAIDVNKRGVSYYTRPMITQAGKKLTNYFTHPDRERCELRVYDFMNAEPQEAPEPPPQSLEEARHCLSV